MSQGQVIYILDKGLVTFAKFAGGVLAIFLTLTLSFYGFDIQHVSKEIADTHVESQRLALKIRQAEAAMKQADSEMKQAESEVKQETAVVKMDVEAAQAAATEATKASSEADSLLEKARKSAGHIIEYESEITLIAPAPGSKSASSAQAPQPGPDPAQVDHLVDARLLEALKSVLPAKQYSALKTKIAAKQNVGFRRQVFDAKNTTNLPGELVRSEGDAPIADRAANEVYDNLEIIYHFIKDVFGWEIPDNKGKTLIVTVHYGKDFDDEFWSGQQIALGDGDGKIYRKGAFSSSLSVMAFAIGNAVGNYTAQLKYKGQSGALLVSFANVMSCLVEQWHKKQTADEASWLVGADVFAPGLKGRALRDMANPGTAYDDPKLGKDPQPGNMKDYVKMDSDNGEVHTNSGIPNRAFVLAAKAIGGHSWEKTGKIWFVTLTERLTANADFAKCAAETVSVARDLFPDDPSIAAKVAKAWADVGVLKEGSPASGVPRAKQ